MVKPKGEKHRDSSQLEKLAHSKLAEAAQKSSAVHTEKIIMIISVSLFTHIRQVNQNHKVAILIHRFKLYYTSSEIGRWHTKGPFGCIYAWGDCNCAACGP